MPDTQTKTTDESEDKNKPDSDRDNDKHNEKSSDDDQEKGDRKKEDQKPKKPPFYKRPIPMIILGSILLIAIVGGVIWWLYARQYESTDDAFIDVHFVSVSPNVAATVAAVHVDDNWQVKKGDLLVQLDPRDYQVIVDQMRANLAAAHQRVETAQVQVAVAAANVAEAEAELVVAQTNADNARRDFERYSNLNERSRSQQQLDNVTTATRGADAQVLQAKAKLASAQADVTSAQVAIKTAQADVQRSDADLHQAQINLDYCAILAPIDGRITKLNVQAGDYVEKAQPLFSIVPTNVWITANYKETQLNLMRPGQDVFIEIDAFSNHQFHGKVDSIQNGTGSKFTLLPPENATGNYVKIVQRIPVKIIFNPGELDDSKWLLAPGMSVVPKVKIR